METTQLDFDGYIKRKQLRKLLDMRLVYENHLKTKENGGIRNILLIKILKVNIKFNIAHII